MGNLLTEHLDLPPPDPNEEVSQFEEILSPPHLEESQRKSINLVGRLFGPQRIVLLAIEGVTGVDIYVNGISDASTNRRVSPGDQFTVKLRVRDTPTRASLRLECAKHDILRLWETPGDDRNRDEVFVRQVRMGKILNGTYDPETDDIDRFEVHEEDEKIKEMYESCLDLPEEIGEDEPVSVTSKVSVPPSNDGVDWVTRLSKGRALKMLSLKTGCQVELKEKSGSKGKEAYLEIQATDETDRATVRLKACIAEAKRMFENSGNEEEEGEDDVDGLDEAEKRQQQREARSKSYAKIARFLAQAKATNDAGSTSKKEGILGQPPPPASFIAPLASVAAPVPSLRQPSPVDAIGPIRNAGHGKGH